MKPHEVAEKLGVSLSAVRSWSADNDLKVFLSPTAQGGENRRREFTEQDVMVLAYIRDLKKTGAAPDEITTNLTRLESAGWDDLPVASELPHHTNAAQLPTGQALAIVDRRQFETRIAVLEDRERTLGLRAAELETALQDERTRSQDKHEALLREIADLRAEMAEQKAMLKLYESGRLKPE